MKRIDNKVKAQAFVCTNDRDDGRACCKAAGGAEFHARLKTKLKEAGIYSTHKATKSGCLGHCNPGGCTVVIYRDGKPALWSTENTAADFDRVYQELVEG